MRIIRVGLGLAAIVLTTQANACLLDESVDCGAVWTTLQQELTAMEQTCESSLSANEAVCAEATGAWQDTQTTWNDYCGGYRIVMRRIY